MSIWGIIPAVGPDNQTGPLPFSKELLPVGSRFDAEIERPRAVSEYLVERMIAGGATKICFVISPGKSDILEYFGGRIDGVDIAYVVQPKAAGLCDALFRAGPVVGANERVLIGLPDTIWFPVDGFTLMPDLGLSFLLFPVQQPQLYEAVIMDAEDTVIEIEVAQPHPRSSWIWGAVKMDGGTFHALHALWQEPGRNDGHLGTLVNAHLARGAHAVGIRAGMAYFDVGTLEGYREAIRMLNDRATEQSVAPPPEAAGYNDGWRPLTARNYAAAFPHQRVETDSIPRSNR